MGCSSNRISGFQTTSVFLYSGLTLNQDKATKPQTVQIVRQGEATPYWFKVNPLYCAPLIFSSRSVGFAHGADKAE
ncbi:hypothetical protein NEIMUCOT_05854 [Neisseria mucosa ATCC 25996]|uniref:Uncharacterized protein n=1 Tax=Neisseria mucosa (strain ATCC 25996 / DSM 4631 / NCTC 10774 / M26) TaxID=546266 RepID=D2ZYY9_NEIM2|nr:hypothetical protein NEIMUCOT_05854 [Neisseria mucosa ATCC 25996]